MKRALSLLLALLMAASLVMPQAWAAGLQEPEPDAVVQQTQPDTAEPDAQLPQADTLAGNAAGLTPITRTKNAVASGVTLEKVVMRNVNGSQVVGYLSEIDLSKDVTLKASYTGYYYDGSTAAQRKAMVDGGKLKWEMSQTTAQAAAYGRASDTEGRVVLATNADYYNMQTGAPTGYLIMEGNLVKTGAEPFFAILKDGSAVIRPAGSDTSDVVEAVSGPYMLVENGQIVPGLDQGDRMPRNSVGIRADGSVVFFEADGRQEPMSIGMSMYEVASFLKDAGCVTAIYLDGGGSATVAARYEGTDELLVRNSPSDGLERTVSDALLVVSTARFDGDFDHASVSPQNELYTPGSQVAFTALGADSAGGAADLPESGLTWVLDTPAAGRIDASTGVFTAAKGYVGEVRVRLTYQGQDVGSASVTIAEPDQVYFSGKSLSLDYEKTSDLGLTVKSSLRDIHYHDGDFTWSIRSLTEGVSADGIGTIVDNRLHTAAKASQTRKAEITVTYTKANGQKLTDTVTVEIGKMPTILLDFEDESSKFGVNVGANAVWGNLNSFSGHSAHDLPGVSDAGFGVAGQVSKDPNGLDIPYGPITDFGLACPDFISSNAEWDCNSAGAPYSWDCAQDPATLFRSMGYEYYVGAIATAQEGAWDMYARRVGSDEGPVRFGQKSLEYHYDYTKISGTNNTNEYLRYSGEDVVIEGKPTALGMWVYAPEGTPNYWLSTSVSYWNGEKYVTTSLLHLKTTTVNAAGQTVETTTQYTGINWSGWKYVEADLSSVYDKAQDVENHPLKITAGQVLLWTIIIEGGTGDVDGNKITCGSRAAGSLYVDNIRAVYGTTADDLENPVITSVRGGSSSLTGYSDLTELAEDGSTVLTDNELQFFTGYYDPQGENRTGVSAENTVITIDGQDIRNFANTDQAVTGTVTLPNGRHSIKVEIMDGFGNRASVTRSFTVKGTANIPTVTLDTPSYALVGENYVVSVTSPNAGKIDSVTAHIVYGNVDLFDTDENGGKGAFNTCASLGYGEGFEGTSSAARRTTTEKTVTVNMTRTGSAGKDLFTFTMPMPAGATALDSLPISVTVTYTCDGVTYTTSTGSLRLPMQGYYTVTSDIMVEGAAAARLYVKDINGKAASGVDLYVGDTRIGTTNASGQVSTDYFNKLSAGSRTGVTARKDNHRSFETVIVTRRAGGSTDGMPSFVQLNATPNAQSCQNITWVTNPLTAQAKATVQYCQQSSFKGSFPSSAQGQVTLREFTTSGDAAYVSSVSLTGLKPGTTYVYRVGDGSKWSENMTFTTSQPGADTTRFFVIGDTQLSGNAESDQDEIRLMNAIAANINGQSMNFGIQTGDFVDNGGNLGQWSEILDVFSRNYADLPVVQVMGNHEYYGDLSGGNAASLWTLPDRLYYSVEYGDVYVAVINFAANLEDACQWLIQDAAKSDCTWKVLAVHQPAYYTNPNGSSEAFNRYIPAAAEAAGINVVFSGHDHSYARTMVLKNGQPVSEATQNGRLPATYGKGVLYYICGDLGEKSRSTEYKAVNNPDFHFAQVSQEYDSLYLAVEATADAMTVRTYSVSAEGAQSLLDTYTMRVPASVCRDKGHDFSGDTVYVRDGKLVCSFCGQTVELKDSGYTGWARDEATGLRMYSYNNAWHTGWFIIDPEVYCFDGNGIAYDGRVTLYGKQFVFDDGVVVSGPTGFVKRDDGKTLYFENGRIASGWKDIGDATYYFETSDLGDDFGVMYTGRRLIGKTWYEFGSDGRLYQLLRGRMSADEKEIVVTITPPAGQGRNYSNIMAAAWSQQDGQDDLVWYNATANGDGTYTIRVPMCKYNVVGRYLVHVYNHGIHGQLLDGLTFQNTHVVGHTDTVASDSSTCVSAGQVKYVCRYCGASHTSSTPAKRHTVSAVVDSECRTMTVTMDAGNGHNHSNVRFAVWSSVNGQDDLTWYTAKKNASGQWTYTVPLVNHNSTGTYFIHVYSSDSGQSRLIGNTTAQVAKLPAPDTVTAQVSDNCRTMSIRLDTARSYSGIRFAVWSSAGGQDDLVWYTAKNGGSGSWTYNVPLVNHNTTGTYFIHVYSGSKLVAHTTAQVAKLPAPDTVTAQVSDNCRTMSIRLDTAHGYSGIRFAVWSSAGGQDDLVWYTAKNGGSGSWTYDVDLARHNTTGTYFIHVYAGNKLVAHTTAQVKSLPAPAPGVKPGLTATVSADNAAMELALTTTAKYGKVRFAVWSNANGQDDLVWYDGRLTGSTWSAGVKLLNHKTLGGYFIHVYADGKLVAHTTANVYGMPPQQSAQAIVTDDFAWMKLRLYSATGYSSIRFAVWSSAGGQDDLVWYKGENIGGAWVAAADLTRHNTTGTYFIHIYSGNKLVAHTTVTVKSLPNG